MQKNPANRCLGFEALHLRNFNEKSDENRAIC